MGACGSKGSKNPERDPDDRSLDELDIIEVGVGEFDDVFSSFGDLLNTCVTINNSLNSAMENLQTLSTILLGSLGSTSLKTKSLC